MSYLEAVWQKLKQYKIHQRTTKKHHFQEVFKGFRTIPIQQLLFNKNIRKNQFNRNLIWQLQGMKTMLYDENSKGTYETPNGFFYAFYDAYISHGDVKFTPDEVWMTILLWFAGYVNKNNEKMKKLMSTMQEGQKLVIKVFQELKQSKMEEIYDSILMEIRKSSPEGLTDKLQCAFTTTTKLTKLFSSAILLNHICEPKAVSVNLQEGIYGLRRVHMGGKIDDWQRLIWKTIKLSQFDVDGQLKKYIDNIKPILQQFISTFKGFAHLQFWNTIFHEKNNIDESFLPISRLNGWITRFYKVEEGPLSEFPISKFAIHLCVNLSHAHKYIPVSLFGGSRAVSQEKNTFRPHFSVVLAIERTKNAEDMKSSRRMNSRSAVHGRQVSRPKTCSLPKNIKISEKLIHEYHLPFPIHLREQMKLSKVNMGEIFQQTFHAELPEIHHKQMHPYMHPIRH